MADVRTIAQSYYNAWRNEGDFSNVALADDFHFKGSIDEFGSASSFRALATEFGKAITKLDERLVVDDGRHVVTIFDFDTALPVPEIPCAEILTIDNGRIVDAELIFDATDFRPVMDNMQA